MTKVSSSLMTKATLSAVSSSFAFLLLPFNEAGDDGDEAGGVNRLRDVELEAGFERVRAVGLARVGREGDGGRREAARRLQRAQTPYELVAVLARHPYVAQKKVGPLAFKRAPRRVRRRHCGHARALHL